MFKRLKNAKTALSLAILGLLLLAACRPATVELTENSDAEAGAEAAVEIVAEEPTEAAEPDPTEPPEPTEAPTEVAEVAVEEEVAETEDTAEMTTELSSTGVEIFTTDDRSSRLQSLTVNWNTNWSKRTIDTSEILSGGPPRDGIPSIDTPIFISQSEAAEWLAENEPVVSLEINGDARAYPLQILTWHEIVNDTVGDVPVTVTFCPLCNSAITFDRRFEGEVLEFGTSGLLRNSDLIMYDRTTETLWQQFTGEGIVGDLAGERLTFLASSIVSFADFQAAFPEGRILSRETGFSRSYGANPYVGYDSIGSNPFLFTGELDGRLPAVERVVTVSLEAEGIDVAYPLSILSEVSVINDQQGGQALVVFHTDGTSSALGAATISEGADVGATGVFNPNVDGQLLTFSAVENGFVDAETGSSWNILGQATDGPLAGTTLNPIIHGDHFWFSWAAFKPDTIIFSTS